MALFRQMTGQNQNKPLLIWQRLLLETQEQIKQTMSKSLMAAIVPLSSKLESQNSEETSKAKELFKATAQT